MLCFQSNSSHVKKEEERNQREKGNKGVYNYKCYRNEHKQACQISKDVLKVPQMFEKYEETKILRKHKGLVFNDNKKKQFHETIKQMKSF